MIRIVSDSSTLYSIAEGKEKGIDILPLSVTINGKTYVENEDINTDDFIKIINEGHLPISSQPAVGDVINIYNKYVENGDEIINITMADGLSGTYNSACMAKNMCEDPEKIVVVNSRTLCSPQRYLVEIAAQLSKEGKDKESILSIIEKLIESSKSYLIPMDFDFLVRGGRLSPLVGRIAGAIKLVPVVTLSEDAKRLDKFTTKRTYKKAVEKICEDLTKNGVDKSHTIYIAHACNLEAAESAKEIIMNKIEDADVKILKLGPVFTTQGGPGCVTIQSIKKYETV